MASKKNAAPAKKKAGRPAKEQGTTQAEKNKNKKPIVVFVSKKLRGQANLAAAATGQSLSDVLRGLLIEWIKDNASKIQKMVKSELGSVSDDDDDNDAEEEEDNDSEESDEEEDEEDEEEESDEEEDEDDDE